MAVQTSFSCDFNEALQLSDKITLDGTAQGTPRDITGWAIQCVVHRALGDGLPLKTYGIGSGVTIPTGTDGVVVVTIPLADVQSLGVGDWVYYIARTDAGFEANLTDGTFSILPV